jgi:tRNA(Ile)-lysidine synthase
MIYYAGYEFRKYQNHLYLLKPGRLELNRKELEWNPSQPLKIAALNIQISPINTRGKGLKRDLLNAPLRICFRKGGEKFHPAGRQHSQSLKKLFQQASIPPWQRDSIPLLFSGDELIAVVGYWYSKQHAVNENEAGWMIDIEML